MAEAPAPAPKASPPAAGSDDVEKNKVFAVLAYFGILVLVPLLAAQGSRFARYHANQGLVLLIMDIILWVVFVIVGFAVPFLYFFSWLLWLGLFVLHIIGIVNAAKGEMKPLPVVGGWQLVK